MANPSELGKIPKENLSPNPTNYWILTREAIKALSQDAPHFESYSYDGGWQVNTGLRDVPDYNMACIYGGSNPVRLLTQFFNNLRSGQLSGVVLIKEELTLDLQEEAVRLGFETYTVPYMRLMANDLVINPLKENPKYEVYKVSDLDHLDKAINIQAEALRYPYEEIKTTMGPRLLADEKVSVYAGAVKETGDIISTVTMVRLGQVTSIWNMGTKPAFQRQGIGTALLTHALSEGFANGIEEFHLISTTEGYHLYQNLGFTDVEQAGYLVLKN